MTNDPQADIESIRAILGLAPDADVVSAVADVCTGRMKAEAQVAKMEPYYRVGLAAMGMYAPEMKASAE